MIALGALKNGSTPPIMNAIAMKRVGICRGEKDILFALRAISEFDSAGGYLQAVGIIVPTLVMESKDSKIDW